MAKEWGFEEDADEDENGLNPARKMIKANPFASAVKKYRNNLGNMLEQTGGGDGAALPFLPESGRRDDNRGIQKPQSSPVPDPLVAPDVFVPKKPEQDNRQENGQDSGQDSELRYRIRLPDGPVGNIDKGIVKQGDNRR